MLKAKHSLKVDDLMRKAKAAVPKQEHASLRMQLQPVVKQLLSNGLTTKGIHAFLLDNGVAVSQSFVYYMCRRISIETRMAEATVAADNKRSQETK